MSAHSLTQPSPPFDCIVWMFGIFLTGSRASAGHAANPTAFNKSIQFTSSPIYAISYKDKHSFLQISLAIASLPPSIFP